MSYAKAQEERLKGLVNEERLMVNEVMAREERLIGLVKEGTARAPGR